MFSKILFVVLLGCSVFAVDLSRVVVSKDLTPSDTGRRVGSSIFFAGGQRFDKRKGKTREPKIIVDTVKMVSGLATLTLNSRFKKTIRAVAATDVNSLYVTTNQILPDTSSTVRYYGVAIHTADSMTIKSSNTGDTSKVIVTIIVR